MVRVKDRTERISFVVSDAERKLLRQLAADRPDTTIFWRYGLNVPLMLT